MTAGAVTLTDFVYWSVIFPFLTLRDYEMNFVSAYLLIIPCASIIECHFY